MHHEEGGLYTPMIKCKQCGKPPVKEVPVDGQFWDEVDKSKKCKCGGEFEQHMQKINII